MTPRTLLAALAVASLTVAGCGRGDAIPPVPASFDPDGKDLVVGAVVAAAESSGGVRLNKIIHVDDYPNPIGFELHMIAYEPKAPNYEEASKLWHRRGLKVALAHIEVRQVEFMKRDHRVIAVEPVTPAEREPYLESLRK